MVNIEQFKIGYWYKGGSRTTDRLSTLNEKAVESMCLRASRCSKRWLPQLFISDGIRPSKSKGIQYDPAQVCFVDIDSTQGVDLFFNSWNKVVEYLPNLICAQRSFSGKLHLILYIGKQATLEDWTAACELNTYYAAAQIEKAIGIDYSQVFDEKAQAALDVHNLLHSQALFVSKYPFVYNTNGVRYVDIPDKEELLKRYRPVLCVNKSGEYMFQDMCDVTAVRGTGKWHIDRNNRITHSAYVDRYLIVSYYMTKWQADTDTVLTKLAEEFDDYTIQEMKKGNYSVKYSIPAVISSWCDSHLFQHKTITLADGEYINADDVWHKWQDTDKLTVLAPTGAGKTVMINNLAKRFNNCLVVVPMNATAGLYGDLNFFGTDGNRFLVDGANCVIWDQLYSTEVQQYMRTHTVDAVIVDECHCIVFDDYRTITHEVVDFLSQFNNKLLLVTATDVPAFTDKLTDSKFIYTRQHKNISITIEPTTTIVNRIWNIYNSDIDKKLVVFSDRYNMELYEFFEKKGIICRNYRALREQFTDVKLLQESEQLDCRVSLCTKACYCGLNIKNEEDIEVVVVYERTYWQTLMQIVGRFRKAKSVKVHILYSVGFDTIPDFGMDIDGTIQKYENENLITNPLLDAIRAELDGEIGIHKLEGWLRGNDYKVEKLETTKYEQDKNILTRVGLTEADKIALADLRMYDNKSNIDLFLGDLRLKYSSVEGLSTRAWLYALIEDIKFVNYKGSIEPLHKIWLVGLSKCDYRNCSFIHYIHNICFVIHQAGKYDSYERFTQHYLNLADTIESEVNKKYGGKKTRDVELVKKRVEKYNKLAKIVYKMLEENGHLDYSVLEEETVNLINEWDDEVQAKKVAGGKAGKEAGRLGAAAGKAQGKKVVEIRTNLEFDTVSDYARYLGKGTKYVYRRKDMWMYL